MDRLDATRGRSPVPAPPRGFAPIVHTPGVSPRSSHQGGRHPGFRPGLWYTGPTARPGTGERPVGAPDHSQGRNPWAPDHSPGRNPGRRNPALPAQTPRQTPRDLRDSRKRRGKRRETCGNSRKRHGKCRETCGTPANATANAERLAGTPANATANAERLAGTPANILST